MKAIAVISQKGGAGKSTIAIGLAVAAAAAGKSVVVIDLDPQPTVRRWSDRRGSDDNIAVVSTTAGRLASTLDAAREGDADLVIIDTAPRSEDGAAKAAQGVDLVLIPIRPDMANLETLDSVKKVLTLAGNPPARVVINGVHPSAPADADGARDAVQSVYGLDCAPVVLFQRLGHSRATDDGRAAQEIGAKKAGLEMAELYKYTCKHVHMKA